MVRLISRQRGGLAALKLTKLFGIDDFPAAKDAGKVLIIIIYCYLIIIIIIIINHMDQNEGVLRHPADCSYLFEGNKVTEKKDKCTGE